MIKLAIGLGTNVHLAIEETGTFDGLKAKVASYRPHVVHLSGHGTIEKGQGKILTALLIERLLCEERFFSPWGYRL